MPCYGRPQRTMRMISSISAQTLEKCELFLIGDGCHYFQDLINNSCNFKIACELMSKKGYRIVVENRAHKGFFGYDILNSCIQAATGEYIVFLGNDDLISSDHFYQRYHAIAGSDYDFIYFNTWLAPFNTARVSQLSHGLIGHSELIVRTEFAKTVEPHDKEYGHDWRFIQNMMSRTSKYKKAVYGDLTYYVMGMPGMREQGID